MVPLAINNQGAGNGECKAETNKLLRGEYFNAQRAHTGNY